MAISATSSPTHTPVPPRQAAFPPPPPPLQQPQFPTLAARVTLSIPLDDDLPPPQGATRRAAAPKKHVRDSQTRREFLLRGKEGSRRRQRWENDRFLHNPAFAPPSKADFEPRPLYPTRHVPYQYASLWEHPKFPRRPEVVQPADDRVPRELRSRLKKAHGARILLEALERELREFILGGSAADTADGDGEAVYEECVVDDSTEDEDEEIVFVSKRMRGVQVREEQEEKKVLFKGEEGDRNASFGRWMVHSIAGYYGLQSWSVTEGNNPAVRYAYVAKPPAVAGKVPKPLYLML